MLNFSLNNLAKTLFENKIFRLPAATSSFLHPTSQKLMARQCGTMPVHQWVYDGPNNVKSAEFGSKPASWLFLFSKKFAAGLPTGKPAAKFSKNQNNQKSSALASLNPCTVEVAETNARKEGIGSFVGSDMCCQLFLFMNQSLQHTPCMCVLNPIVSTFHH